MCVWSFAATEFFARGYNMSSSSSGTREDNVVYTFPIVTCSPAVLGNTDDSKAMCMYKKKYITTAVCAAMQLEVL